MDAQFLSDADTLSDLSDLFVLEADILDAEGNETLADAARERAAVLRQLAAGEPGVEATL